MLVRLKLIIYIDLHICVVLSRVEWESLEIIWIERAGFPDAKVQIFRSWMEITEDKADICDYMRLYWVWLASGMASMRIVMQSLLIGIVVYMTIRAKRRVQRGSTNLRRESHQMIMLAMITPMDWTISPITWIIAALM